MVAVPFSTRANLNSNYNELEAWHYIEDITTKDGGKFKIQNREIKIFQDELHTVERITKPKARKSNILD